MPKQRYIQVVAMEYSREKAERMMFPLDMEFCRICFRIMLEKEIWEEWSMKLFYLCSWVMQIRVKPNCERLTKRFIYDNLFGYCDNRGTIKCQLNKQTGTPKERRKGFNDELYFKNYRTFCNRVAWFLSRGSLTINKMVMLINNCLLRGIKDSTTEFELKILKNKKERLKKFATKRQKLLRKISKINWRGLCKGIDEKGEISFKFRKGQVEFKDSKTGKKDYCSLEDIVSEYDLYNTKGVLISKRIDYEGL